MRRRDLLAMLGGVAVVWPLGTRAQQASLPVIGLVSAGAPEEPRIAAFRQGLGEAGYVDGKNVAIEFRWAEGHFDRLPALAADLVGRRVAVMVATGGVNAALVAKAATSTIPIVFMTGGDPVKSGIVESLGRPGGNVTGVTFITAELNAKRMELLHELAPKATLIALLVNPDGQAPDSVVKIAQDAARAHGSEVHVLRARTEQDIDAAFATLARLRAGALLVASDAFFLARREQIVALAARHAVPASYDLREFVAAGGLMSYGPNLPDAWRQGGIYAGRFSRAPSRAICRCCSRRSSSW